MKEHPIIFSPPMVNAIIDGHKTQTRRVINPQPDENGVDFMPNAPLDWESRYREEWKPYRWDTERGESICKHPPYGYAGDLLYVRENFKLVGWDFEDDGATLEYCDGSRVTLGPEDSHDGKFTEWLQREINKLEDKGVLVPDEAMERYDFTHQLHPFNPSIHLPRWGSRILLEVTKVRIERLQDISEGDAYDEGVRDINGDYASPGWGLCQARFKQLWESINGKKYPWQTNPWVWVIEFKIKD